MSVGSGGSSVKSLQQSLNTLGLNVEDDGDFGGENRLAEWMAWYRGHKETLKAGLTEVDHSGDPDELLDTTQAAKLLGYTNPSTITNYVRRDQFVQPDRIETTPSGGERRFWTRRTLWIFADQRTWSRAPRRRAQTENTGHDG